MASKRKLSAVEPLAEEPVDPSEELMFLCLGGGLEVGRSCHIIQYKGKTVMLDAGMHPAYDGYAALPYYDEFDLSTVDVLLISHFHVDHAASLPYVLAKTNFKGRVFMTHPTKAIYKWLIQDSVRVSGTSSSSDHRTDLYTEEDHLQTFPRIEAIDYDTTHTVSSIRITPYAAGHVLGAAMFLVEIAGLKILFTGDYSREHDRHLRSAEIPKHVKIDVLITESTYGIASHVPRVERETALMKSITGILNRGGKVLMPVFALGRAQEMLLILEEYWSRHPEFQRIPIYYASNLARKCLEVYARYISSMNDNIKRIFREKMAAAERSGEAAGRGGPWDFSFIRSLRNLERFDDVDQCVVLASPGMLQNGVSRELLERWAPDPRNGVVITGYSVEGTMAKEIMNEPEQIPAIMSNRGLGAMARGRAAADSERPMIPRRCSVQEFSFAAHVDGPENVEFIEETAAPVVILVHGERHNMTRLKSKLMSINKNTGVKVYSPENTRELRIPFKQEKTAKVVGKLAQMQKPSGNAPDDTQLVSGVLVQNDFKLSLMAPEDLKEYAGLTTTTLICKQHITLSAAGIDLIRWALAGTFGAIEEIDGPANGAVNGDWKTNGEDGAAHGEQDDGNGEETDAKHDAADEEAERGQSSFAFLVMGCVKVLYEGSGQVTVEWEGNVMNDGVADAVLAVLFTVETSPAAVKQSAKNAPHPHAHDPPNPHADVGPEERLSRLCMMLEAQFGPALTPIEKPPLLGKGGSGASDTDGIKAEPGDDSLAELEAAELRRLHRLGIPVPGIEVKVDRYTARIWLETLEVECASAVFAQRVKAVVDRAVETVAPLWRR